MIVLVVVVAAVLLIAVAGVSVAAARSAGSRRAQPASPARVDLDEAAEWVSQRLPDEMGAALSRDDVRRIIDWNLEYFRSRSTSSNGHGPHNEATVVVAGAETVDYVLAQADAAGVSYTSAQVHAVLDAQMSYLARIGALASDVVEEPPAGESGES